MTDHVHPQRETYPFINSDDELVMVFRDHLPATHTPVLFIKALQLTELRVDSSRTLDDRAGFVVLDFSAGGTDTVTLTVDGGAPTVLTEGSEFDAVISNNETAIQIAAAINTAAVGLTASFEEGSPNVFVAPTPGVAVRTFTLDSDDFAAWDPRILATVGPLVTLAASGHSTEIELPSNTTDPTKKVSFLKIIRGRISADLRSPVVVRTYFRQPATLRATTGQPGGWPTSP